MPVPHYKDLKAKVDNHFKDNKRFTITVDELIDNFPMISRSLSHEILTKYLGYRKICARWVPRLLTDYHKQKHMAAAFSFLEGYDVSGDGMLYSDW